MAVRVDDLDTSAQITRRVEDAKKEAVAAYEKITGDSGFSIQDRLRGYSPSWSPC